MNWTRPDWGIESIRITSFLHSPVISKVWEEWSQALVGEESIRVQKNGANFDAQALLGNALFTLRSTLERVDITLQANVPGGVNEIGKIEDLKSLFGKLINNIDKNTSWPQSKRLAVAATMAIPVENQRSGNRVISEYLPDLQVDFDRVEDLLFRVNRPTVLSKTDDIKINHISTWQIATIQVIKFQFSMPGDMSPGGMQNIQVPLIPIGAGRLVCQADIEVNTDQARDLAAPGEKQVELFINLIDRIEKICLNGDRKEFYPCYED